MLGVRLGVPVWETSGKVSGGWKQQITGPKLSLLGEKARGYQIGTRNAHYTDYAGEAQCQGELFFRGDGHEWGRVGWDAYTFRL